MGVWKSRIVYRTPNMIQTVVVIGRFQFSVISFKSNGTTSVQRLFSVARVKYFFGTRLSMQLILLKRGLEFAVLSSTLG